MLDITAWMNVFLQQLDAQFGARIWFVGLQGSYSRGEATEESDIDVVVILDTLSSSDLLRYRAMLDGLPHRERICGFFSGENELLHWEPSDLFQFYYDTTPVRGNLDELLPLLDETVVWRAIKMGACNIYHACVHNMLHEKSEEMLRSLYKSASFVVQAICFAQTGSYIRRQADLREKISPEDRGIIDVFFALKNGESVDFDRMSEGLFLWAGKWIEVHP